MHLLTPHIAIKHLEEQIKVFENMIDSTTLLSNKGFYRNKIQAMKEKVLIYSQWN